MHNTGYRLVFLIYDIRFTLIVLGSNPLLIIVETLGLSEKEKEKTLIIMVIRVKVLHRRWN